MCASTSTTVTISSLIVCDVAYLSSMLVVTAKVSWMVGVKKLSQDALCLQNYLRWFRA
jgi:hypothetical protein